MTPNEKAVELVEKYKDYVHGYVGSSMLTNYEYPEQILSQAKKVAVITVDEILKVISTGSYNETFYKEVKDEIAKL